MNYLVFRLRKYLSEEDTFWMFALIVESYLPPDFYVEMYGATTHATILVRVFEQYNIFAKSALKIRVNAVPNHQSQLPVFPIFILYLFTGDRVT